MASWTELSVAASFTQITLDMWNKLSGNEGNLQYLYEKLANYSLDDYYAYGFYNPQTTTLGANSFVLIGTDYYDIEPSQRTDERPDDVEAQFYDDENYGNIKIQTSGVYIINGHALPINEVNSEPQTFFSLKFEINDTTISSTSTVESSGASTAARRLTTPNPLNYYSINRLNEGDIINPLISVPYPGRIGRLIEYTGSWYSGQIPFAKTPYVSMLFLSTPRINIDIPSAYFYFAADPNYVITNQNNTTAYRIENTDISTEVWKDSVNAIVRELTSVNVILSPYSGWNLFIQDNNKSYVYPFNDNPLIKSKAVFTGAEVLGLKSDISYFDNNGVDFSKNARYLIIGIQSLDSTPGFTPGVEQNLISFIVDNNYGGILTTASPVTLSATVDGGGNITLWLRVYERIHQIQFSDFDAYSEIMIAIEFVQLYNDQYFYTPKIIINNKIIVSDSGDNSKIISLANNYYGFYDFLPSYDMQRVTGIEIGGNGFYSATDNQSNLSTHLGYYFIGDWFLDDEVSENQNTELQKQFLWEYLSNHYNITLLDYNYTVTSGTVDDAIILDQFVFGDDGRFI